MTATTITGQWMTAQDGGGRWWFDSGSLTLDFAHTGAMDVQWERLHSPADLHSWLTERFPMIETTVDERALSDALMLRAAIAHLAFAASSRSALSSSDIDVVNLFAATPDLPPALDGGSRQAGASRARATQALSTIARDSVTLFGPGRDRVRECSADDCSLVYLDTSRSRNRRWCSMQRCGNRAKVRAHRARNATHPG